MQQPPAWMHLIRIEIKQASWITLIPKKTAEIYPQDLSNLKLKEFLNQRLR